MATKEYNLSVIENVTTFSTPLKQCSDYTAILSLIKEEVDIIQTEDEMDYNKATMGKSPLRGMKRKISESCSSESVFKSPLKKRYALKLKSPRVFPTHKRRSLESLESNAKLDKQKSLGRTKSGRSSQMIRKKHLSSTSLSEISDYAAEASVESPKKVLENEVCAQSSDHDDKDYKDMTSIQENIDLLNADNESGISSKGETSSIAITESLDGNLADESFVESSQSTTTLSELRHKLELQRNTPKTSSAKADIVKEELQRNMLESDEDNYSLALSPEPKSHGSNGREEPDVKKEKSLSPPRQKKRKAVCRVSPLKDSNLLEKTNKDKDTEAVSPVIRKRKLSAGSPFKGLTQEFENCIRNSEYVEMCDSDAENMSFTFETIQLLNEFDDCHQQVNNKILDKILSSPTKSPEESLAMLDDIAPDEEQPGEDPLHLDENKKNEDSVPSTSKRKRSVPSKPKVYKRKSTAKTTPKNSTTQASNTEVHGGPSKIKQTHTDADAGPSTTNGNSSLRKTPRKSTGASTPVATSSGTKRRTSERLRTKHDGSMDKSGSEDENDRERIEITASTIAKKVAVAKKRDILPEETINKLNDIVVKLRHVVPPQHEIEKRAGTSTLSHEQQMEFLNYAELCKTKYTSEEDEIIKQNWKDFCEDHSWDPDNYKPFLLFKHGEQLIMSTLEERRKFVQFLANGLPNRPLFSVYTRFRILFNKYTAIGTRYTKEDDANIIAYMKRPSSKTAQYKCSELAKIMNRSRTSVWQRYTKLNKEKLNNSGTRNKKTLTKVDWNLPLTEKFITTLLDVTLSEDINELKDAFLPRVIWLKMEEKMKIHFDVMQRYWDRQLHMQLFAPEEIYMNELKIKLIEYMHIKKIRSHKNIQWRNAVKYFDGYTVPFLRSVFNYLALKTSRIIKTNDFNVIIEWLRTKKIRELRFASTDKCLPRILYKDKKIEVMTEDLGIARSISKIQEDD